jgi:hypothetical protein
VRQQHQPHQHSPSPQRFAHTGDRHAPTPSFTVNAVPGHLLLPAHAKPVIQILQILQELTQNDCSQKDRTARRHKDAGAAIQQS